MPAAATASRSRPTSARARPSTRRPRPSPSPTPTRTNVTTPACGRRPTKVGSRSRSPERLSPRPSVAGAGLHLLALGRVGAALLLQRRAGEGDVGGEAVDLL